VGLAVGVFVTWLAVAQHGLPLGSIATSMLCGGLIGGLLYHWSPKLAQQPLTAFCLTLGVSVLRTGRIFFFAPYSPAALYRIEEIAMAPVLRGLGTALILAIVGQVRDRDEQTRAVMFAVGEDLGSIRPSHSSKRLRWMTKRANKGSPHSFRISEPKGQTRPQR